MVFYFSATGNSLYVAKQLDANAVSIPQIIHKDQLHFRDDAIGIVYPVYGSEPPQMVQEFLKKATFETDYFYALPTYGCNSGASPAILQKIAAEDGIRLDYVRTVLMVDNYLPAFDMEQEKQLDKKIPEQLARIRQDIQNRTHFIEAVTTENQQVYDGYQAFTKEHPELAWKNIQFSTTEACIGCGLCANVCPAGKIRMEDGRPVRTEAKCQVCMACIHACPAKAIQMSVPEANAMARYRNPCVSAKEIVSANKQMLEQRTAMNH